MDTLNKKQILKNNCPTESYLSDTEFDGYVHVIYDAMDEFAIKFGNILWKYLPYVNRQFQNPMTEEVFTIEQILNGEDENYHEL